MQSFRACTARAAMALAALALPSAHAADEGEGTTKLERRVQQLEQRVESMDTMEGGPTLEWSGLVEVEGYSSEDFSGTRQSDFELATVELGIEGEFTENVSSNVVLLYEGGTPEDVVVDEAVITLADPESPWRATFGRTYVPFGAFRTNLVSDPLPLELGETQETAAVAGFAGDRIHGAAYVYNGTSNNGGDDTIEQLGLNLGVSGGSETAGYDVGVGYIGSIADSDALSTGTPGPPVGNLQSLQDYVGGYDLYGSADIGDFTLIAEYLAAVDAFDSSELAFNGRGAEPSAYQAELGYGFEWAGMPATASVGFQGTEEAVALGLPENRALAGVSVEPWELTRVSVEWAADEDYSAADGASGNSADTLTVQLSTAF